MTIEAQLEAQTKLLIEIRDLLAGGAAGAAAAEAKTEKAEGKRTRKSAEKTEAKVETKAKPADDLDDDLDSGSAATDDLDDDLNDDLNDDAPKYTAEQVKSALMDVKAKISKDKALEIMKGAGKSASVSAIAEENFAAVMTACEKALKAAK